MITLVVREKVFPQHVSSLFGSLMRLVSVAAVNGVCFTPFITVLILQTLDSNTPFCCLETNKKEND